LIATVQSVLSKSLGGRLRIVRRLGEGAQPREFFPEEMLEANARPDLRGKKMAEHRFAKK
jgi:hypothetical protein